MRRLCAVMLTLQALVTALAIPVAISISHESATRAGWVGGGLAVLGLLIAGCLRFRWAYYAGSVLQVLVIATGFVVPVMFFLGVIFGALWASSIWVGSRVESAQAR